MSSNFLYYTKQNKKRRRLSKKINKNYDSEEEEQLPFPLPLPDIFNKPPEKKKVFRDGNHIYFRDSVTIDTVNKLCNLIQEINNEYNELSTINDIGYILPKPVYVHICSMGGDLFAGFMAYDYIKNSHVPIYTVAEGYTVSAGSIMFMGGKKRFMTPSGYILIHQLRNETGGGTAFEMQDENINCNELMKKLKSIYLDNINKNTANRRELLKENDLDIQLEHDLFWDFKTCMQKGICHEKYINAHERVNQDKLDVLNNIKKYSSYLT